jgi:hypothetical protein
MATGNQSHRNMSLPGKLDLPISWAPTATVRTAAECVVEAGRPGIASVSEEPRQLRGPAGGPIYDVHDDMDAHPLRG